MNQVKLLVTVLLLVTPCFSQSIFKEIFLTDCDGAVYFFPSDDGNTVASGNLLQQEKLYSFYMEKYIDRVQCACPDATAEDILRLTSNTPEFLFNQFSAEPVTSIADCQLDLFGAVGDAPEIVLPETCDWFGEGKCLFQFEVIPDVVFDVAVVDCPNSYVPLVSVGCSGSACSTMFMPCAEDSECGDLVCAPVQDINGTAQPTMEEISDILESLLLAEGDCLQESDFITKLANFVRKEGFMQDELDNFDTPKYCLPAAETDDILLDLQNSTRLFECQIEEREAFICYVDGSEAVNNSYCPPSYECKDYDSFSEECLEYTCNEFVWNNDTESYDLCIRYACDRGYYYDPVTFEYDYDSCKNGYTTTFTELVDCVVGGDGPLSGWDGMRSGQNIVDWVEGHPFKVLGSYTPFVLTEGAVPILDFTCDFKMNFMSQSIFGASISLKRFQALNDFFLDIYRNRFDCEAEEMDFVADDNTFGVNYFLGTFFALLTADDDTWNEYSDMPLQTFIPDYFFDANNSRTSIQMPSTCNYESWTETGRCALEYDGLSALFGLDWTFNILIEKCGEDKDRDVPSIYIECVGENCNLLNSVVSCDPEDYFSCPNAECLSVQQIFDEFFFTEYYGEEEIEPTDLFAEALGVCGEEFECDCSGDERLVSDVEELLTVLGVSSDVTHICVPAIERFIQTASGWSQTQGYVDRRGRIVISDLEEWKAGARPEPTGDDDDVVINDDDDDTTNDDTASEDTDGNVGTNNSKTITAILSFLFLVLFQ